MQKEIWQKEYKSLKNVPSSRRMRPSKVAVWLIKEFVSKKKIIPGKALDIGSGKGRNAIYLAKNGYEVVGIEIVEEAIKFAKKEAKKKKVEGKVKFIKQNVGKKLVLKDKSFDLILDIWTMHLLNSKEREIYIKEMVFFCSLLWQPIVKVLKNYLSPRQDQSLRRTSYPRQV